MIQRFPAEMRDNLRCLDLCHEFNQMKPSDLAGREAILRKILHRVGKTSAQSRIFTSASATTSRPETICSSITTASFWIPARSPSAIMCSSARAAVLYRAPSHRHRPAESDAGIRVSHHGRQQRLVRRTLLRRAGRDDRKRCRHRRGQRRCTRYPGSCRSSRNPCRVIRPITEADREARRAVRK